ncbi:MAG: two-component regulator propeller domain-containing protein, partial [Rubricoccaceae bacterium]|nr:two-component regulator propeller domain-containing protein [Rubricoccaceae bacterium]
MRYLFLVVLGCSLLADMEQVAAQPLVSPLYSIDFFGVEEGLPGQQVYDIEQTSDGYLWVATNAGLARFDGLRFTTFDSTRTGIPTVSRITALYRNRADTLFFATWRGQILSYSAGKFSMYLRFSQELVGMGVADLTQDSASRIVAPLGGGAGLAREDRGVLHRIDTELGEHLLTTNIYTDVFGSVWVGAGES